MDAMLTGSGETRMADEDLCVAIGEDLTAHYPGYPWFVGCDHAAGSVHIDLLVDKPIGFERYGFLLYISTVLGAGGQKAVLRAGGELLERFGLRRGPASPDTAQIVREHGLIIDGAKNKSKH